MTRQPETFRTLYVDPGEDAGWAIGRDTKLIASGTTKLWSLADDAWDALENPYNGENVLNSEGVCMNGVDAAENQGPIGRIVAENWTIYPWATKDLAWDECRTARLIGALTFMARLKQIPFITQPAAIKEAAKAAGAEELFEKPLHENRHANDAKMHYVFFTATELLGLKMALPDGVSS